MELHCETRGLFVWLLGTRTFACQRTAKQCLYQTFCLPWAGKEIKCENDLPVLVALNLWSYWVSCPHHHIRAMQKSQIPVAGLYTLFVFIKVALLRLTDTVCSNDDEQVNLACDQAYMHCMHIYRHLWSLHFSMLALLNLHILRLHSIWN